MVDILIHSSNEDFKLDLQNQISRFISDSHFVADLPDVIIIDDDSTVFADLRQVYPQIPIVFLGQTTDFNDTNLNIILRKPFRLNQLLDILCAANHNLDYSVDGYLRFNGYELRPRKKEIEDLTSAQIYKLTEKEIDILKYLYKNANQYVDKTDLQTNVWGYHQEVTTHTVETHIYRLRQKVEHGNRHLITTENGQYQLIMRNDYA